MQDNLLNRGNYEWILQIAWTIAGYHGTRTATTETKHKLRRRQSSLITQSTSKRPRQPKRLQNSPSYTTVGDDSTQQRKLANTDKVDATEKIAARSRTRTVTHRHSVQSIRHVGRKQRNSLVPLQHEQQVVICIVVHVGCCRHSSQPKVNLKQIVFRYARWSEADSREKE